MADCPSCGRHVGPYNACPHCGAALGGRVAVRSLKIAALLLALGGLALLWFFATRTEVSLVEIGQVNAMMNMAYVRVEGQVIRPPSLDPETGYFSFWLRDDTGELRVAVYQKESKALISEKRAPALGDHVAVEGTLRVREDSISLTLNVPERLEISCTEPVALAIADITPENEFARVRVRGQVRGVRVPYPGLTLVDLRDSTGEIELAIPEVTIALNGNLPPLVTGQTVEVVAPVSLYKDAPQLSLARTADLTPLQETLTIAPQLTIGQIASTQTGEWATISGEIIEVSPFSSGVKHTLDDGTGQITLLLWQDLYNQLTNSDELAVGAVLRAQGQVTEYRGELEIVPELPSDLIVVSATLPGTPTYTAEPTPLSIPTPLETASPTPAVTANIDLTLTPTPTTINDLTATPSLPPTEIPIPTIVISLIGNLDASQTDQVTIVGQVADTASFSQGFKFTLDDGSGQIVLLMWHDVYDDCWAAPRLNIGATVQVTGEVGQFEGEMQIEPKMGGNVHVISPGSPFALHQEIGSVGAFLDQRVIIIGQIIRVEETSSGLKVSVADDTGEVLVFIWDSVLERVLDAQALNTPGTSVRVVGVVQEYYGDLEVVPVLPHDVVVLP